jgi:hypothetical protein
MGRLCDGIMGSLAIFLKIFSAAPTFGTINKKKLAMSKLSQMGFETTPFDLTKY